MKKVRPFYHFLLSYVFILLIPLVIGIGVYREIIRIVEQEEKKSNLTMLVKARDTLDSALAEIEKMVLLLGNDPYVKRFAILESPVEGSSTYYLYELGRRLSAYYETNSFVHSFYIYFKKSDSIFMRDGFYNTRYFYENYYSYKDMDYYEWREVFFKPAYLNEYFPAVPVTLGPISHSMITCIRTFPGVYLEDPTIVIWVLIDEEKIKKLLSNISAEGCAYIINGNNRIMASVSESENKLEAEHSYFTGTQGFINEEVDNQKVITTYTTSLNKNWKYVSVIPYKTVLAKTNFIRWLMTGICLAILILGFITAYMLALRSTKPLKELVRAVKEKLHSSSSSDENEYDFIKKNVNEIADLNKSLQREMQQQLPILRAAFFERLFRGEYNLDTEIHEVLSRLGIEVKQGFYLVLIARINIYDSALLDSRLNSLFMAKAVIKRIISRRYHNRLQVHDKAEDEIVLLMCYDASESASYRNIAEELLSRIYDRLLNDYNVHVSFSAGNLYPHLSDVWHSYREGMEASEIMRISKSFGINWFNRKTENRSDYYYPLDIEERLMNNTRAGNKKEACNILSLIYRENIENRNLPAEMLRFLMNNMCCSIVKILRQRELKSSNEKRIIIEKVKELRHCEAFDEAYEIIENIYKDICDTVDCMKKSHNKELVTHIKEYIQMHHGDVSLNLYEVASRFDMAEVYLSSFFKEQTGIRFSDFLEEVRMNDACELLTDRSIAINSIAKGVGYGSVKAFSRAFKRVKGVIPTEYRKIVEHKQIYS